VRAETSDNGGKNLYLFFVNAERIVEFVARFKKKYPNKKIVVMLNNAPYNRATYITIYAGLYGIELFFLPLYSPNLNLIEKLWKFLKKKLLINKYYERFEEFLKQVKYLVEDIDQYDLESKRLLTQKFQIL
jgi:transposase